jgi:hypothetical protein
MTFWNWQNMLFGIWDNEDLCSRHGRLSGDGSDTAQPGHTVFTKDTQHSRAGVFLKEATHDRPDGHFHTVIKYQDSDGKHWETLAQ